MGVLLVISRSIEITSIKLKVTEWFCWCCLLIVVVLNDCSTGRERCAVFWFCEGDRPSVAMKRAADGL